VQDFIPAADTTELVLFRAGGECFAVPLDSVREVIDAAIFHRLPGMPAHVTAVISVAGRSLPIYDGARFLGVAPSGERPSVLVMKGTEEDAGLVVDALMATFPIEKSVIRKVPALEDGSGALAGVFFHGGELVALLDPSAFIRQRENPKPAAAAQKGRGDP
jgi:purine-binding chemotaxis protein CheW